jgi:hypothetical protein
LIELAGLLSVFQFRLIFRFEYLTDNDKARLGIHLLSDKVISDENTAPIFNDKSGNNDDQHFKTQFCHSIKRIT